MTDKYEELSYEDELNAEIAAKNFLSERMKGFELNDEAAYYVKNKFRNNWPVFIRKIREYYKKFTLEGWEEEDFDNVLLLVLYYEKKFTHKDFRITYNSYKRGEYDHLFEEDDEMEFED